MDAFTRLSKLGSTVKGRASSVWKSALLQVERGPNSSRSGCLAERNSLHLNHPRLC
jgi:hypothetical protein